MSKLKISYKADVPDEEMEEGGLTGFISWARLRNMFLSTGELNPTEKLRGIVADKAGIKLLINNSQ